MSLKVTKYLSDGSVLLRCGGGSDEGGDGKEPQKMGKAGDHI